MRLSAKMGPLALGCVLAAACTGNIGTRSGSPGQGPGKPGAVSSPGATGGSRATGGSPGTGTGGGGSGGGNAGAPATGPAGLLNLPATPLPRTLLHRLTAWEFANSLQDLLGSKVPLSSVEVDTVIGGFATVGDSTVSISPAGVRTHHSVVPTPTPYPSATPARATP